MEITYSTFLLPLVAMWLGLGALGVFMMVVADIWMERRYGLEPLVVRPDYVLAGPLVFLAGLMHLFLVFRASRR